MADIKVIDMIRRAAKKTGADPVALLATALTENGARYGLTPGDNGTSYSAFQWHKGGALGNHPKEWTLTQDAFDERAGQFAKYGVHHGKGAAAVQRPADAAGYEKKVNSHEQEARQLLKLPDGTPATTQPGFSVPGEAPQTTPQALVGGIGTGGSSGGGITVQGLLDSSRERLGGKPHKSQLLSYLMQQSQAATPAPLKLPDGTPAKAQPSNPGAPEKTNSAIVNTALTTLGTDYSWGGGGTKGATTGIGKGANTKGFDCSGLVQYAVFKATGATIPRVASAQYAASTKVAPNQMQPGDIIAFGSAKNVHHIGIYMGNGKFVESPHTGAKVRISNVADRSDIVGAGRFPTS